MTKLDKGLKGNVFRDKWRIHMVGGAMWDVIHLALGLFKDMIMLDMVPNVQIYNSLITELCHSNRLDESYTVLVDMKNRGISPT